MGHVKNLSVKAVLGGLPLFLVLALLNGLHWFYVSILIAIIIMAVYIIGELIILPETGYFTAVVMEGALVLLILFISKHLGISLSFFIILLSVISVVVAEGLVYYPLYRD